MNTTLRTSTLPLGKHYFACTNSACSDCDDVKVIFIRTEFKSGDRMLCNSCGEEMNQVDWRDVELSEPFRSRGVSA